MSSTKISINSLQPIWWTNLCLFILPPDQQTTCIMWVVDFFPNNFDAFCKDLVMISLIVVSLTLNITKYVSTTFKNKLIVTKVFNLIVYWLWKRCNMCVTYKLINIHSNDVITVMPSAQRVWAHLKHVLLPGSVCDW